MSLATYVEQISDAFQSTFTVVDENTLANMMGMPGDFVSIETIIKRYMPDSQITFHKTDQLGEGATYDIYLVRATVSNDANCICGEINARHCPIHGVE